MRYAESKIKANWRAEAGDNRGDRLGVTHPRDWCEESTADFSKIADLSTGAKTEWCYERGENREGGKEA